MRFEYFPSNGDPPLVFDADQALTIPRIEGLSEAGIAPVTVTAPGQFGGTLIDATIGTRTLALTIAYRAADYDDMLAMRRRLSRAFFTPPPRAGGPPAFGRLRAYPRGLPALELDTIPAGGPAIDQRGPTGFLADVELLAPYPYWRETTERFVRLEQAGGFIFPLSFPLAMPAHNVQLEVDNEGNVPVGVLMRLYGGATTPRLRNLTTGEVIEITGAVAEGSYVEVDTRFGRKVVELVDGAGARTRIMGRLNLARSDFWHLQPGLNVVRFEADATTAGSAGVFLWTPEVSGL